MRLRSPELCLAVLLAATPVSAAEVSVTNAWIRALPAHLPDGGYFTIKNIGKANISLTGAETKVCGMLMLHKSSDNSGMSAMMDVQEITIPAGASVAFAPGGYHLMCMDPAVAVRPGAKVPVTLQFSDGTSTTVPFAVKDARGK